MNDRRNQQISSIRQLADLLEEHPEIPVPFELASYGVTIHLLNVDDPRARMVEIARLLPGKATKEVRDRYYDLCLKVGTLPVTITAYRKDVCERVVVATREVVEEVPDPDALATVPTVTVTNVVEDVEWRCGPLLAEAGV